MKYFEIEFDNGATMCIKGADNPTCKEAEKFVGKDMEMLGGEQVISVIEISKEEAHNFFDMKHEYKFPVFIKAIHGIKE